MRAILILALFATAALAQSVGDFSIPYKANAEGPATVKSWAKGNSKLWGTDASGNPESISVSGGLQYSGSTLTGPDLSSYLNQDTADGLYQPLNAKLTTLSTGFGGAWLGSGIIRWNGTTYQLVDDVIPSVQGGTGFGIYFTEGTMLYSSGGSLAKLEGNTTTTKKFLSQTGNGSASAAPAWSTIGASDITGSISNAQLANSSITINGSAVSLGGSTTIATGLTIGTTTVSGASSGDILINTGGFLQKLTPSASVTTAIPNATNATGGFLDYGIIGTSGAKVPLLNAANTFSANQAITGSLTVQDGTRTNFSTSASGTQIGWYGSFGVGSGNVVWNGQYGTGLWIQGGGNNWRMSNAMGTGGGYFSIDSSGANTVYLANRATNSLGLGLASGTPATQTFGGQQGSGSNITGGRLDLFTAGTGTGTSGPVTISTHGAGSSGSALGVPVIRVTVKPSGIVNFSNVPSSSAGLSSGDIYQTAGALMIVP